MNKLIKAFKKLGSLFCGKRAHRVIAAVLSLVVVVSVCTSLIMPAISADDPEEVTTLTASSDEFAAFWDSYNSGDCQYFDISSYVTATVNSATASEDGNSVDVNITASFSCYDYAVIAAQDRTYLYFSIDPRIFSSMTAEEIAELTLSGTVYNGSVAMGSYVIDPDTGLVIIKVADGVDLTNGFQGAVTFKATVERTDEESSDFTQVTIGTQTVKITGFTKKQLGIEKTGVVNYTEGEAPTVTWTVVITNPYNMIDGGNGTITYEANDLGGYTISDTMFGTDTTVTSDPANAGTYDDTSETYTFNSGVTDQTITLTYTTTLTADQLTDASATLSNTATLKDTDETEYTDTASVTYDLGFSIEKTASTKYTSAGAEVTWTITITNKYGLAIDDLKLYDSMFGSKVTDITDITVEPGDSVTAEFVDGDSSRIIFSSVDTTNPYTGDITITYTTTEETRTEVSNTAQVEKDEPLDSVTKKVTTSAISGIYKSGSAYYGLNLWKISLGINVSSNEELNGFSIQDDMLQSVESVSEWVTYDENNLHIAYNSNNADNSKILSTYYYDYDAETGTITFKNLENLGVDLTSLYIQYYTEPEGVENGYATGEENVVITNEATVIGPDNENYGSASGEVTWKPETTTESTEATSSYGVYKSYDSTSTTVVETEGTVAISWSITAEQANDTFANKTITDVITTETESANITHYMTLDQLENIKITNNYNWQEVPSGYYNITYTTATDNDKIVTSFTITFTAEATLANYGKVYISYYTTALIGDVSPGETVYYNNTVSFEGEEDSEDYPYTAIDYTVAPYVKTDSSGSTSTTNSSTADLTTITIDGVEYYKLDYVITVNDGDAKYTSAYTLVDVFPEGWSLYQGKTENTYPSITGGYVVGMIYNNGSPWDVWEWNDTVVPTLSSDGTTLTIYNQKNYSGTISFYYSLIMAKETLDAKLADDPEYKIVNTLSESTGKYPEVTQTQEFEEATITKNMTQNAATGYISYEVYVNPEGATLSTDGKLVVTDVMTSTDNSSLKAYLESITLYTTDADGNYTVELDSSQYTYILDNDPEASAGTETEIDLSNAGSLGHYSTYLSGLSSGEYTVYFTGEANTTYKGNAYINYGNYGTTTVEATTDENGQGSFTFSCDTDSFSLNLYFTKEVESYGWTWDEDCTSEITINSVTTTVGAGELPYIAKLTLTIPDSIPIKIVYTYMGYDTEYDYTKFENASCTITNTVDVTTSYGVESDSTEETFNINSETGASLSTQGLITIQKVDVADYSKKLEAGFYLYKYVGTGSETTFDETISSITYNFTVTNDATGTVTFYNQNANWEVASGSVDINGNGDYSVTLTGIDAAALNNLGYFQSTATTELAVTSIVVNGIYEFTINSDLLYDLDKVTEDEEGVVSDGNWQNGLPNVWWYDSEDDPEELYTTIGSDNNAASIIGSSESIVLQVTETTTEAWMSVTSVTYSDVGKYYMVGWGSTSESPVEITVPVSGFNVALEDDVLYKLVEVTVPGGYDDDNKGNTVYFSTGIYAYSLPAGVTSYTIVGSSGTLNVPNYKDIDVTVQKIWADGASTHGDITVTLYQSTTLVTNGFPDDSDLVEINTQTLNSSDGYTYTWTELPSGTTGGKVYYYYVKEADYSEGEGESAVSYTAYYVGNATDETSTITVTNTSGLTVEKKWLDYDGNSTSAAATQIYFKLYYSTTQSTNGSLPSDAVEYTSGTDYISGYGYLLSSSNDWMMTFANAPPEDGEGNDYYYYVVEVTDLSDNKVSYIGNGSGLTGVIEIYNKSTKIVVGEMPETGGPGTFAYTLTGGLIIALSAAAYILRKRFLCERS
ncbi:MAG: Cna B-type domain-containing protein [Ruminococcus sp.]|nr:Cna B-type domain-containing protein [Ruminococcus sp.]